MNLHRGGPRERLITRAQHENNYLHVQDKTIKDLVGGWGDCSTVRTGLIFFYVSMSIQNSGIYITTHAFYFFVRPQDQMQIFVCSPLHISLAVSL